LNFGYILARKNFFSRGCNGSVSHAKGITEGLALTGNRVTVFTGKGASSYLTDENINAIESSASMGLFHLRLVLSLITTRKKLDFVIVRYSTMFGGFYCILMNLFFPNQWCFELNSFGYQQLKQRNSKKIRAHLLVKFMKWYELKIMKYSNMVSCVSDSLTNEIKPFNSKVFTIPNAAHVIPDIKSKILRFDEKNKIKLIYFGMYHSYYELCELANDVSLMEGIELHLYGTGELNDKLEKIAEKSHRIFLHGRYVFEELINQASFDGNVYLVLPYKDGTIANVGSPTKLFEYLALGLPIISSKVGQPFELLDAVNFPLVTFYERSIQEIVLDYFLIDRDVSLEYFKQNHTWNSRAIQYVSEIQKALKKQYNE